MARIRGNNSNNSIAGTNFADEIFAFSGNDRVTAGNGHDIVWAGAGNDTLNGGSGNDRIYGEAGADTLVGDTGNDTLEGGSGADRHFGNAGTDWVSYARSRSGVGVDLLQNLGNAGDAAGDTFSGIENIIGSNFDDGGGLIGTQGLYGNAGNNIIMGLGGDDTLFSNGGNDTLLGGSGNDIISGAFGKDYLDGGAGMDIIDCGADNSADRVVLHRDATDTIFNFDKSNASTTGDRMVISKKEFGLASGLTALTEGVNFYNSLFDVDGPGNIFGAAGTRVFINDVSGAKLYFDKDGAGGVAPVPIAAFFPDTGSFGFTNFILIA